MHTSENNVFHITGNTNGFFANQSTDSEFNPEANASYPNLYVTLPAILCALSSGFKQWFNRSRQIARSSNMNSILRSLPLLPSLLATSKGWFDEAMEKESGNLFDLADQMMSDELAIPQLASVESHHWMTDYNMIRWAWRATVTRSDSKISEDTKASLILSKEQSFAEAATKACRAIVDGGCRERA